MSRARQIAALAASEPGGALAWLDGGAGRGFVALEPDLEVVADDLTALPTIEALWRSEPGLPWFGWLTYEVGTAALLGRPPTAASLPGLVLRRYRAALELGARERIHGTLARGQNCWRGWRPLPGLGDRTGRWVRSRRWWLPRTTGRACAKRRNSSRPGRRTRST
ncbi:hypothetical protein [Nannocystis pusilla]|uniref:hypothetical protein n=1 Tax=Nannocystis pusilla TaxID=889268 RepID=UPI003B7C8C98